MVKEFEIIIIPNEDEKIEYKEKGDYRKLAKEIVALSNYQGGIIKIGISDDKRIVGVEGISSEDISNIARNNCKPAIIPKITQEYHNGKEVLVIEVPVGKHIPYRTIEGRYMIRVGKRCDDVSLDELIDLIVNGSHKGTILLKAKLDDLKNTITASISSNTDIGTQHAIEGINELIQLIQGSSSELAKLEAINVLDMLSKRSTGLNEKVTREIILLLSITFSSVLTNNYKSYVPSEKIMSAIIDIIEDIFKIITIFAEKTDLVMSTLNAFYRMALGCFWAGYENQVIRICKIISQPIGRDRKLSKYLEKTLKKIEKCVSEENVFEPRRMGMLLEKIED